MISSPCERMIPQEGDLLAGDGGIFLWERMERVGSSSEGANTGGDS